MPHLLQWEWLLTTTPNIFIKRPIWTYTRFFTTSTPPFMPNPPLARKNNVVGWRNGIQLRKMRPFLRHWTPTPWKPADKCPELTKVDNVGWRPLKSPLIIYAISYLVLTLHPPSPFVTLLHFFLSESDIFVLKLKLNNQEWVACARRRSRRRRESSWRNTTRNSAPTFTPTRGSLRRYPTLGQMQKQIHARALTHTHTRTQRAHTHTRSQQFPIHFRSPFFRWPSSRRRGCVTKSRDLPRISWRESKGDPSEVGHRFWGDAEISGLFIHLFFDLLVLSLIGMFIDSPIDVSGVCWFLSVALFEFRALAETPSCRRPVCCPYSQSHPGIAFTFPLLSGGRLKTK